MARCSVSQAVATCESEDESRIVALITKNGELMTAQLDVDSMSCCKKVGNLPAPKS